MSARQAFETQTGGTSEAERVSMQELRHDLDRLRHDVSAMAGKLAELTRSEVDEQRRSATERAQAAADETRRQAKERYEEGRAWFGEQLETRPATVLGVAFAAGVVLGRFLRR